MGNKDNIEYYKKKNLLNEVIFGFDINSQRYTQDSPVFPGVWIEYFFNKNRIDLLLVPHRDSSSYALLKNLRQDLISYNNNKYNEEWGLGNSGDIIVANLLFDELIHVALPYTRWYKKYLVNERDPKVKCWYERLVYLIKASHKKDLTLEKIQTLFSKKEGIPKLKYKKLGAEDKVLLWSINKNRNAHIALNHSVTSIKGNASTRLFNVTGQGIRWAIIDSGIDAQHPAFCKKQFVDKIDDPFDDMNIEYSRIVETYDFTMFRKLFNILERIKSEKNFDLESDKHPYKEEIDFFLHQATKNGKDFITESDYKEALEYLANSVINERILDWSVIRQFLRVPHNEDYKKPNHSHGTHVAGILGADMSPFKDTGYEQIIGVCPDIEIIDIRVIKEDGSGDEFSILAAIQFIKWLNRLNDQLYLQGVNMSISLPHDVSNYACGRTPVCEESQRLIAEGTVVIAAAGNQGQTLFFTDRNEKIEGFRTIGITDPGNAMNVITVGATHRSKPLTYGVSYFSSRGPTGDGRTKPDLVAPGEKIISTLPSATFGSMDGTSMAAPHVSGAAALLLAKNRELIGNPLEVKRILCESATDLGREKNFQGFGMLDCLRALQKV